jgi:hypothetical protein
LQDMPNLQKVNGQPLKEFWRDLMERTQPAQPGRRPPRRSKGK